MPRKRVPREVPEEPIEIMRADDAMRGAYIGWRRLLDQLLIAPATRALFEKLPFALASFRIRLAGASGAKETRAQAAAEEAVRSFIVQMVLWNSLNWTQLLEAFARVEKDPTEVANALDSAMPLLCMHDVHFLVWLQERGLMPRDLGKLYQSYLEERQGQGAKQGA